MLRSWYKDFSDQQRNGLLSKLLVRQTDRQMLMMMMSLTSILHTLQWCMCVGGGGGGEGAMLGLLFSSRVH